MREDGKWKKEMEKRSLRRERPSNDCGERDEMELSSSDVKGRDEDGKENEGRWKRRMNKEDKLEREEKQPEGIKLSPFSSI